MEIKIELPPGVNEIFRKFESAGYEIYIVGGAVRDILTTNEVDDWDFTTNATPEEILKLFPLGFYDNKFGTVGISGKSEVNPYEITTFRKETGYSDSRRPDKVEWGKSLEEDLKRRDFTVNAMALVRVKRQDGKRLKKNLKLIDLFDGQKDLKNKMIRAVGNPNERFQEDALRLMRAVRIATELGFTIHDETLEAIKANAGLIHKIAYERVRDELLKILACNYPHEGILLLKSSGLLGEILPELEKAFGVEQKSPGRHHIYDVGTHLINSLKEVAKRNSDPITRFATLIHDIGKPQTFKKLETGTITFYNHEVVGARISKNIADRLRFSKKDSEKLWRLVRYHQFTVNENQTDSALRRFIKNVTPEYLEDMLDLRIGDRLGSGSKETSWRLEEFKKRLIEIQKQPFSVTDLKINGRDVMEIMGIQPGPKVGEVLNKVFEEVVEKNIPNKKEALLSLLKKLD